ncbi:sls1p [Saccharomyces arboricola H-6]|uniref:Sls1p n=1 Tax=Saccharomyces arboricola (strain H-6 / AS 2.3317 / CBS 10644) TaxID=1160507 RepID=J8PZE1_SACAR|nr:sls1p [Saccharomyces arboricola H-6]
MWNFNRKLVRLAYRLYSNSGPSSPLHGKKKLPQNLKFVVLNPTQSGLVKNDHKLLRHTPSRKRIPKESENEDADFGSKLLVFEKQNSLDSALNSIRLKKPTNTSLPLPEYNALLQSLTSSYNRHQLREFIFSHLHSDSSSLHLTHWKKSKLSQYIVENVWHCQPMSTPSTRMGIKSTSLTFQFDTPREIFLLLITQNGKILTNFNKLGLTFIISIQDNELTIKGSPSLLKYVEISLNKIWSNITHENVHVYSGIPSKDLINLIQKETHTFFEYFPDSQTYKISALSTKKISMAKVFLLNAITPNPHASQHNDMIVSPAAKLQPYPFDNTLENLDWLNKSQDWSRLQLTIPKNCTDLATHTTTPQLTDAQVKQYETFLSANAPSLSTSASISHCLSMTLGYSLQSTASSSIFQPLIHKSFISKLLSLPTDKQSASLASAPLDQHLITNSRQSFVQLNFTPVPPISNSPLSPPLLQIWFETDELDNIITTSMRPLLKLQENSIVLQTPQCQTDYKITSDYIQDLLSDFDQTRPDDWLSKQKGLQEFLMKSHWKLDKYQNLMKKVTIALPNGPTQEYQLTDILTHRVLNLRFSVGGTQDKYIIQYSDINRGFLNNGSYKQLDFINVNPNEASLKTFINDVLNF